MIAQKKPEPEAKKPAPAKKPEAKKPEAKPPQFTLEEPDLGNLAGV